MDYADLSQEPFRIAIIAPEVVEIALRQRLPGVEWVRCSSAEEAQRLTEETDVVAFVVDLDPIWRSDPRTEALVWLLTAEALAPTGAPCQVYIVAPRGFGVFSFPEPEHIVVLEGPKDLAHLAGRLEVELERASLARLACMLREVAAVYAAEPCE